MSLLLVLAAVLAPMVFARLLMVRFRGWFVAPLAASLLPGTLVVLGSVERVGWSASGLLINAGTEFARGEQWTYLLGGCGLLFVMGLPIAALAFRNQRRS